MNKRFRRFQAATCALLMAGMIAMTGCGSSGGDSNPSTTNQPPTTGDTGSVTYSGTTTQAPLDSSSGATVSSAATTSITSVSTMASGFGLSPDFREGAPDVGQFSDAPSITGAASLNAPTTTAGTCPSNPGSYTVDAAAASGGGYNYSITYNKYCTGNATNSYTMNGSYTISGTKGNYTATIDKMTATMVYGSYTATIEYGGKIVAVTSGNVTTTTINYAYNVTGTGTTAYSYKLENFVKKDTVSGSTVTTELTGRFYYGSTGYVDITTPTPLTSTTGSYTYTAGNIRYTGSGGGYYEITYQSSGSTTSNFNSGSTSTAPTITSFTPTSGAVGTTVTISGTNFSTTVGNNTVKFNGTAASVTAATATSLTVTVPTGATTGTITVTTSGGTATSAGSLTITTTGGGNSSSSLIGTWVNTNTENGGGVTLTSTFNADGTYVMSVGIQSANLSGTCTYSGGTYIVSGNTLSGGNLPTTATPTGSFTSADCSLSSYKVGSSTWSVSGNTLTITSQSMGVTTTYTRQ